MKNSFQFGIYFLDRKIVQNKRIRRSRSLKKSFRKMTEHSDLLRPKTKNMAQKVVRVLR